MPTWAILTSDKPIYTDSNMSRLRYLNVSEIMALQTFPEWYRIVSEKAMPGTQQDKVRLLGNAVPPLVSFKLMLAA